jgi:hypothetical protein
MAVAVITATMQGPARPARAQTDEAPSGAEPGNPELTEEDAQLLREIDLLLEWELLRDWDPEENLPIPVHDGGESTRPPGEDP